MFNSNPDLKKATILHVISCSIMLVAIVFGVAICTALAMGYRFDILSGKISQVALLQFNSLPKQATVTIDGNKLSANTPVRANVPAGVHRITLQRNGYRPWNKTISLPPRTVAWLDYIRLVPNSIPTESALLLANTASLLGSPDHKWLAAEPNAATHTLQLIDTAEPLKLRTLNIDLASSTLSQAFNAATEQFHLVEWDSSSRFLLLEHAFDNHIEYLLVDCRDKAHLKTINISKLHSTEWRDVRFNGGNGESFYAIKDGNLYNVDLHSGIIGDRIAENVSSYAVYGNNLISVVHNAAQNPSDQVVSIYYGSKLKSIKHFNDNQPVYSAIANYNQRSYLFLAHQKTLQIIANPLDSDNPADNPSTTRLIESDEPLAWLQLSPNGRMVYAGYRNHLIIYDTETKREYQFNRNSSNTPINFLDDCHIFDQSNQSIDILDFDGTNRQSIVSGRLPAALSSDNKYIFSLDHSNNTTMLQRSKIVTD